MEHKLGLEGEPQDELDYGEICIMRRTKEREDGPCPVDANPLDRSEFGVLNMAGNVSELTSTEVCSAGSDTCIKSAVWRGGGWEESVPSNTIAEQQGDIALDVAADSIGFRCVVSDAE
jgi:formylglycine-generating enzyme required for sulfatase activity